MNLPGKTSSNTSPVPAPTTPKPTVNYTESDLDLLARLITVEAQSEPYSAQVAVASVVINRIKSSQFPNSISSVIYQKSDGYYQFTPVLNGWINKPATERSKKLLKKLYIDLTQAKVHYIILIILLLINGYGLSL
ncbi:cell Wall Hydrolase family protein [Clostridium botulinum]|nr:cell Wall Hydrolase family protein [Clostridium botulinum]APC85255.1 cell Wall Hydrolase family protein [Clostridium botulinum]EDT81149.1 cell Wall hydrolase [Clostridium botulinum NCTC 2916]